MSEKTAEEKLRQALEGSTTSTNEHEPPKDNKKPRPSRARPKSSPRTVKSENLGERLDSFMDDFERRIEESLNAVKSPSESHEHHAKPSRVKISAESKPETSRRVRSRPKANPKPLEELIPSQPESSPEISHAKKESAPETQPVKESVPISEPETVPESLPIIEPEPLPETSHSETESLPEIQPLPESLPVSEPEPVQETSHPETESAPEIQPIQEELSVIESESLPEISHTETESAHEIEPIQEDLPVIEPEPLQETSQPETESVPEVETMPEDLPVIEPEPEPEISHPETESAPEVETVSESLPIIEPEPVPEISQPETEPVQPVQEEIIPDVIPLDEEYEPEPELPDIPVIEADFNSVPDSTQEIFGGLPEIPVISPDDDIDDTAEIFTDGLEDIITPDETETSPHEDETETRREPQIDFQEAELLEAPDNEDDFADIDTEDNTDGFTDEPLDEEPAVPNPEETEDAPPYDIESDEAGFFADNDNENVNDDDDTHGDFSPAADVVLNVDDEIPRITPTPEAEIDPESESVPVTVTMPESTKTAEDKLMADIAEAMTGNPLTLDSQEQPGLYNLPENFFTDNANPDSPQSAEDKLKANIAQALSESPINTAQDQANQSLEHDINPFDELSENETHDEELLTEESNDDDLLPETNNDLLPQEMNDDLFPQESNDEVLPEETNDDDLFPKETHDETEESLTDFDAMTEDNTTPNDDEIPNDPFTIPDLGEDDNTANLEATDDETRFFADAFTGDSDENASKLGIIPKTDPDNPPEATLIPDFYSEPDETPEPETLITPDITPESETESEPEISAEPESTPESSSDDDMPFPVNDEPDNVPLTEQEALIAMVNQQFETENTHKEAEPENNMPEQSLLNDETPNTVEPENENNDDWDISSLGELGQVATLADDNEDFTTSPGTVTEMITQPEPTVPHNPEEDHKEKTMSIREKLALRKNKNSDGKPSGNSKSGFLMPLLVLALAVIGGLILWQLMQLSDKITSMAMNAPGYESVSGAEPPSYEYAIDFILDPNLSDRMSQRGHAGWQVVGSRRTQDSTTGQYGYEFIFMRRTPGR